MATYSFTRLSSGTVKVVADGNTYFIPGDCKVNPNDSLNRIIITDRYGAKITMDSELDTINIAGIANTGTATEIAEDLATDIFFLASSGGGGISLNDSNVFTQSQFAESDVITTGLYLGAGVTTEDGYGGVEAYAGNKSIELDAYGNDYSDPSRAGKTEVASYNADQIYTVNGSTIFQILSTGLVATIGLVGDYADDAAAATGGVPVGGLYRTSSVLKIRVA